LIRIVRAAPAAQIVTSVEVNVVHLVQLRVYALTAEYWLLRW
jgi:hypothetical protein